MKRNDALKRTMSIVLSMALAMSFGLPTVAWASGGGALSAADSAAPQLDDGSGEGRLLDGGETASSKNPTEEPKALAADDVLGETDDSDVSAAPLSAGVAEVNGQMYPTLKDAFAAVPFDGTETVVRMLDDVEMISDDIVTVQESQNAVLDMAGHRITAASDGFKGRPVVNRGTLVVQGDGTIDVSGARENGWGSIENYGTLTVVDGTFRGTLESNSVNIWNRAGGNAAFKGGRYDTNATALRTAEGSTTAIEGGYWESPWYSVVENGGTMTISGGDFKNTSCSACDSHWGYTVRSGLEADGAYLAFESGTVTGVQGGLAIVGGSADIYGGTFSTVDCVNDSTHTATFYALYVAGDSYETSATVYGGEFSSSQREAVHVGNNNAGGDGGNRQEATIVIKGGSFMGGGSGKTAIVTDNVLGGAAISGGTFSAKPADDMFAQGYEPVQGGDGSWGVVVPDPVASIGGVDYPSVQAAIDDAGEGETVALLANTAENIAVSVEKSIALDLSGFTLSVDKPISVTGELVVEDSKAVADPAVSDDFESVTYAAGKIVNTRDARGSEAVAVEVKDGGVFTQKSGTIESMKNYTVAVYGSTVPGASPVESKAFIEGGYQIAPEGGPGVFGNGAYLKVSGGVIVGTDNAAVAGNGTNTDAIAYGGTTIDVAGGTLIGHIVSDGYIACGIYHPQSGVLNISGGTIYADGGVGILMRGGVLDMTGGTVIATGSTQGKVGDSTVIQDCYGIQIDGSSKYYDSSNSVVHIQGGSVSAAEGVPALNVTAEEGGSAENKMVVSGGEFSSEIPADYCAEGFEPVRNADGSYGVVEIETTAVSAYSLIAYEGGMGENALPDPEWAFDVDSITVDDEPLSDSDALPFEWEWVDGSGAPVDGVADEGVYELRAWKSADAADATLKVDGTVLEFADDGTVVAAGSDTGEAATVEVRAVANADAAVALDPSVLRPVYNSESPLAPSASSKAAINALSVSDGGYCDLGTIEGGCDGAADPHAHVAKGTRFLTSGNPALPIGEGSKIGLLWDDLLPEVLGSQDRVEVLNEKGLAAVSKTIDTSRETSHEFKYVDLVDMANGNAWVGADGEDVTVFWPYPEGVSKEDEIAVAYFEGLTRDYTLDMESADLDAEIVQAKAHSLEVVKTDAGVLFDVPSQQFGPFELVWQAAGDGGNAVATESNDEGDGQSTVYALAKTGDTVLPIHVIGLAAVAGLVMAGAAALRRMKEGDLS